MRTPRPTARSSHSIFQFRERLLNADPPRLRFLPGRHPADPLVARERRDALPYHPRRRHCSNRLSDICRHSMHHSGGNALLIHTRGAENACSRIGSCKNSEGKGFGLGSRRLPPPRPDHALAASLALLRRSASLRASHPSREPRRWLAPHLRSLRSLRCLLVKIRTYGRPTFIPCHLFGSSVRSLLVERSVLLTFYIFSTIEIESTNRDRYAHQATEGGPGVCQRIQREA